MKYQVVPLGTPWRIDDLKNALQDFPDIHIMDIRIVPFTSACEHERKVGGNLGHHKLC